jgi:hypothetical protein
MKVWLEDSVPTEMLESIKESQGKYTVENQKEAVKNVYLGLLENRKAEISTMIAGLKGQTNEITENTKIN